MTAAIRVVLVEPSHPGNVGAVARAMKTMGLADLRPVKPPSLPSAEATARAAGADDVLAAATAHDRLDEAVADCHLVLGSSARLRSRRWPLLTPPEAATRVAGMPAEEAAAVVFGRERSGLSNAEMDRCHGLVHIDANPDYSSLNLAGAVQIIAYELRRSTTGIAPQPSRASADAPATAEELARFYEHLEAVLTEIGFLEHSPPAHLMRRLRRLFSRTGLERREVKILRGILSAVQDRIADAGRGGSREQ